MARAKRLVTPFVKGHQIGKKLTTPELKRNAYEQYCAHLAKGKSKRSFVFDHPELTLTWETMEKYLLEEKANPIFDPKHKKMAESKGFSIWETIMEDFAKGERDGEAAGLQMIMRNKFGWDKAEEKEKENERSQADNVMDKIDEHNSRK